jgi:hypothetical protein
MTDSDIWFVSFANSSFCPDLEIFKKCVFCACTLPTDEMPRPPEKAFLYGRWYNTKLHHFYVKINRRI